MRKLLFLLSVLTLFLAPDVLSQPFNPQIDADEIENYIRYLASEELKGRKPGTDGDKAAANYIKSKYIEAGLTLMGDNGFQYFDVTTGIRFGKENFLSSGDSIFKLNETYVPLSFSGNGKEKAKVVFAGYGFSIKSDTLSWDDYSGIDANGKWVLVFRSDPDLDNIASPFTQFGTDRYKVMNAMDHGAAGVILVNTTDFDADDNLEKLKPQRQISAAKIPVIQVKRNVAEFLIHGAEKSLADLESSFKKNYQSASFLTNSILNCNVELVTEKAKTMNVIGMQKGKSDEYIVIGGHYDHLGMGSEGSRTPDTVAVHYGADDNASGVAMLIEMVQKISIMKPERNIVFIAFGAEEMGLLGSRYFVENPLVELKQIKVMFNLDMVGRLNIEKSVAIGGTGTALETDSLLSVGMDSTLFTIAKSPGGTGPSDHSSFYSVGIPVLFFSTGVNDQYHTPFDQADLINYEGMELLGNSIFDLLGLYMNNNQQLTYQESQEPQRPGMRRRMKVTLGIVPDFAVKVEGLGVAGVRAGGPAYNGGMKKGDVIISIDNKAVTNIYDYMFRMGNYSKDQRITVEVLRNEKKKLLIIQL